MDNRNEVREFLASRRAKVTPDQAGLPSFGGQRRAPGLRGRDRAAAHRADFGLTLIACSAEPGTDSHDSLSLLASWATTSENASVAPGRPAG